MTITRQQAEAYAKMYTEKFGKPMDVEFALDYLQSAEAAQAANAEADAQAAANKAAGVRYDAFGTRHTAEEWAAREAENKADLESLDVDALLASLEGDD